MTDSHFPLSGPPPEEVPLKNAPLVKVIVQVAFPEILKIREGKNLSEFQELIREEYPFFERKDIDSQAIELASDGAKVRTEKSVIWRFFDPSQNWTVSLAPNFLALETIEYSSRADILKRLTTLVSAVEGVYNPRIVVRLGMRYIDQLKDGAYEDLAKYVRREIIGVFGLTEMDRLQHGITEASFTADEGNLLMRCAHLAPQTTFDPGMVKPIPEQSWILDLDLSDTTHKPFNSSEIVENVKSFSERLYASFRWLVTDDFMKHYGGEI